MDAPETRRAIRFVEWAAEGRLRHAAFLGLRIDKKERGCVESRRPGAVANERYGTLRPRCLAIHSVDPAPSRDP